MNKRNIAIIAVVGVIGLAVVGGLSGGDEPEATVSPAPSAEVTAVPATAVPATAAPVTDEPASTPVPVIVIPPTPEPDPQPGFATKLPGELITLLIDDEPWANITVSKVSEKASYKGEYSTDKPSKGNIFLQAWVEYKALVDGVDYNPYDWDVYCNDTAVDNWALVLNGPEPTLDSGTLSQGRKATGWVVYEVPKTGQCVMSYADWNGNVVVEVMLRDK